MHSKPHGRQEVAQSLLNAAIDDYTSGRTMSVRTTAKRAGVNHGQIHHIFGGKDGLKAAMLEALSNEMDARIEALAESPDLFSLLQATVAAFLNDDRHVRALARQALERDDTQQARFPVVERIRDAVDGLDLEVDNLELYLAEGLARGLGWILFRDWIRNATGIDDDGVARLELCLANPLTIVPEDALS